MNIEENINLAKQIIKQSDGVLITCGAGMGVDSGLPDFRGNEGFWKEYPIVKDLQLSFSDMANPSWFETNPKLAWAFYGHRLHLYRDTVPHKGFNLLLNLMKEKENNFFIFTSNVDGQFQKAGFSEEKIVECHGSIHHFQCTKNCTDEIWDSKSENIKIDKEKFEAKNFSFCPHCKAIARPNILMFGDFSWNSDRTMDQEIRYEKWLLENISKNKKLAIIEVGAGTAIPTVRLEGERIANRYKKAQLIRINPREFNLDGNLGVSIPLGGLEGISKII
jgi:NAD-dependent SIR2 family protein deacetylase